MKDIMNAPFVEEMKEMTANMYRLGWDERNGGNISYLLKEKTGTLQYQRFFSGGHMSVMP